MHSQVVLPGGRPRAGRVSIAALMALAAACSEEPRASLLQVDVVVPAGLPEGEALVEVDVGGERRRYQGALPAADAKLLLDMHLPRRLSGDFEVWVRLVSAADCILAENSNWVILVPGERAKTVVRPVMLTPPLCDRDADQGTIGGSGDGGPVPPGPVDEDAAAEPDLGEGEDLAGPDDDAAPEPDAPAGGDGRGEAGDGRQDGGTPDRMGVPVPIDARPLPPQPQACASPAQCPAGQNCLLGHCEAAPTTCAAIKTRAPASADGIYFVNLGGRVQRVYCDMAARTSLCAEVQQEHRSTTRDTSRQPFALRSVLDVAQGLCRIWAVRNTRDGYPFDSLSSAPIDTCRALGFKADHQVTRVCRFGANPGHTKCGFAVNDFYKWANSCSGCTLNSGRFTHYILQGKVFVSAIPWTMDGSQFALCKVR